MLVELHHIHLDFASVLRVHSGAGICLLGTSGHNSRCGGFASQANDDLALPGPEVHLETMSMQYIDCGGQNLRSVIALIFGAISNVSDGKIIGESKISYVIDVTNSNSSTRVVEILPQRVHESGKHVTEKEIAKRVTRAGARVRNPNKVGKWQSALIACEQFREHVNEMRVHLGRFDLCRLGARQGRLRRLLGD